MEYVQHEKSQVVQTAWAVLALIYGDYPDKAVIERACRLLMSRQQPDGRWEQEDTEGIFNKNCAIDYPGKLFWLGRDRLELMKQRSSSSSVFGH